ncbi:MAG: hypothetical protein IPM98_10525 [Lewinellaceae bacterium]|nr:hypothetical protein [Lewinellaceae bacterium]
MMFGQGNLGTPIIQNYTRNQYGAGTQNWDIEQTKQGLIVVANNDGMMIYDGARWILYPIANATNVRSIAVAEDGRIYAGGQNELGYYAVDATSKLTFYSLKSLIPAPFQAFEDIWDIALHDGRVFFRSISHLYIYNGVSVQVIPKSGEGFQYIGMVGNQLWLQDFGLPLQAWQDGRFVPLINPSMTPLIGQQITGTASFHSGFTLIGTLRHGIYQWNNTTLQPWASESREFLMRNGISKMALLGADRLVVGTSFAGIVVLDTAARTIYHLDKDNGLQQNNVLCVYADQHENVWMGLHTGIDLAFIKSPFAVVFPDGNAQNTSYAIQEFGNELYFGTSGGLYKTAIQSHYDPFSRHIFKKVAGFDGQVWGMGVHQGQLLVGHHEGAFRYTIPEGQDQMSKWPGTWTYLPLRGHSDLLLAGDYNGLVLFALENGRWVFRKRLEGLQESCRIIVQDAADDIWVAHPYRGVFRVRLSADAHQIETVTLYNSAQGFPTNMNIYAFRISNELVFGTEKGIYRFNSEANTMEPHEELNTLLDCTDRRVMRLVEDQKGNIWYVLKNETGVLNITGYGVHRKYRKRSIPWPGIQLVGGFETIYPLDTGHVFFGAERGVIHLQPALLDSFPVMASVLIRAVELPAHGDSVLFSNHLFNALPTDSIQGNLTLGYRHDRLRFRFASPDFTFQDQIQYRCFLEGFDKVWSPWSVNDQKEYLNLRPGTYTFCVMATTGWGRVSAVTRFQIRIMPPWYASSIAFGLYILFVLSGVAALVFIPRKRFQEERALLEHRQEEVLRQRNAEFNRAVAEKEQAIEQLHHEKLETDLQHRNRELASLTMHLLQKNALISHIAEKLEQVEETIRDANVRKHLRPIKQLLFQDEHLEQDWEQFVYHFDQVHSGFFRRLREQYPQLTPKDHRLCAYLRMNLTTKEIAPLLNISVRGVEIGRYRLRRKMGLGNDVNLNEYMMNF